MHICFKLFLELSILVCLGQCVVPELVKGGKHSKTLILWNKYLKLNSGLSNILLYSFNFVTWCSGAPLSFWILFQLFASTCTPLLSLSLSCTITLLKSLWPCLFWQVKTVKVEKRMNEIVNRLNKTKVERMPDLKGNNLQFLQISWIYESNGHICDLYDLVIS